MFAHTRRASFKCSLHRESEFGYDREGQDQVVTLKKEK